MQYLVLPLQNALLGPLMMALPWLNVLLMMMMVALVAKEAKVGLEM